MIEAAKVHDAEVDALFHAPDTVHVPAPVDVMYAAALLTSTVPRTDTVEAFARRTPVAPLTASPPPIARE